MVRLQLTVHVFNNDLPTAEFTVGFVKLIVCELDVNMLTWQGPMKIPISLLRMRRNTREPTLNV